MRKMRRRSFSLVEVLISIILLGITSVPIMNDAIARIKAYQNIKEKLQQEIALEESFFQELAWLATDEEVTFDLLDTGYEKEQILDRKNRIITEFVVITAPENSSLRARLGELSVSTNTESSMVCSVLLAFEEKL